MCVCCSCVYGYIKMIVILMFGVLAFANVALPASVAPNINKSPHSQSLQDGRAFKGQYVQDGAYKVQLTLLSSLAPPFETPSDRTNLGRQYTLDSKEYNDDRSIRVNTLTPTLLHSPGRPTAESPDTRGKQSNEVETVPRRLVDSPYDSPQYVADNLEKRFDDGSDKSAPVTPRLVSSPYGSVPAGSGPEGQYVPDNLEKLYDDGSDRAAERFDDGLFRPRNLAERFDDGLYKPKYIEREFDDGLYRSEELAKRFDDGLIKF